MKKIAIIDDEKEILEQLAHTIIEIDNSFEIDIFTDTDSLFNNINNNYDTYIVDIFLGDNNNGIDFVNTLYKTKPGAYVIFISGKPKDTFDVYDANHVYFLEKPINLNLLKKAIFKILDIEKGNTLKIEAMGQTKYIPFPDIIYIESRGRKVIIHTTYDTFQSYNKLDLISSCLPSNFKRIHKSIIINKNFLQEKKRNQVTLTSGQVLGISRSYIKEEI